MLVEHMHAKAFSRGSPGAGLLGGALMFAIRSVFVGWMQNGQLVWARCRALAVAGSTICRNTFEANRPAFEASIISYTLPPMALPPHLVTIPVEVLLASRLRRALMHAFSWSSVSIVINIDFHSQVKGAVLRAWIGIVADRRGGGA